MGQKVGGEAIEFVAAVNKVQTLADGGLRVTLDLPEDAIIQAAWLMVAIVLYRRVWRAGLRRYSAVGG